MDSGDKATNKAMSIAFKYACFQVFCIPTEEMVDPDAECHEVKVQKKSGIKTEEEMKATETQTIDGIALTAVKKAIENNGYKIEKICEFFKLEKIEDMTVVQLRQFNDMIERDKKK